MTTSDGHVVVAGRTTRASTSFDFLAMKLDPVDGEVLWTYEASFLALISLAVEISDMMSRIGAMGLSASLPLSFWCAFP